MGCEESNLRLPANQRHLLKLQADWLKPYLHNFQRSASKGDPALVTAFNTALFELVLLVELPAEIEESVRQGDLPKMLLGKHHRQSQPLLVVEFRFRAIPERTKAGSYAYRGRAELTFTSYALNDDELAVLRREIKRNEFGELFEALEEKTPATLQKLPGFPMGLRSERYAAPSARRGMVARSGDGELMIDAFVFPGNSGGPVVYTPPIKVSGTLQSPYVGVEMIVGVVVDYVPFMDVAVSPQTRRPRISFEENSGLCHAVPTDKILEVIWSVDFLKFENPLPKRK